MNNGKYCIIEKAEDDRVIIRKCNRFYGSKLFFLQSKSLGISISRSFIPGSLLKRLSTKGIPVKIGVYLNEWDTTIKDLFSTESKEDGELADALSKFGEVEKQNKFKDLKADIIFKYKNKTIPIEVTTTKPSESASRDQHRKSSIKSSQILIRFYFSMKWNILKKFPTILVLHKEWTNYDWIKKEADFMRRFSCYPIFTDFQDNWEQKASQEIKRLTESSLFNNTTPLGS